MPIRYLNSRLLPYICETRTSKHKNNKLVVSSLKIILMVMGYVLFCWPFKWSILFTYFLYRITKKFRTDHKPPEIFAGRYLTNRMANGIESISQAEFSSAQFAVKGLFFGAKWVKFLNNQIIGSKSIFERFILVSTK